jgi:hypothetical protein
MASNYSYMVKERILTASLTMPGWIIIFTFTDESSPDLFNLVHEANERFMSIPNPTSNSKK